MIRAPEISISMDDLCNHFWMKGCENCFYVQNRLWFACISKT